MNVEQAIFLIKLGIDIDLSNYGISIEDCVKSQQLKINISKIYEYDDISLYVYVLDEDVTFRFLDKHYKKGSPLLTRKLKTEWMRNN